MSALRNVLFISGGVRCAADLYLPSEATEPAPCVVMGHGGSGTKRMGLPAYAAKFARSGIAALAFDYRGFGASEGEPRQVIDVAAQRDDYRAALEYVRALPEIDPRRVGVWGTSLSGGHVLAVGATDPRIAAVVSQVPMIDGMHRGRTLRQRLNKEVAGRTLQFTVAALQDVLRARRGQAPYLVPVVAPPGQRAVFTEPDARTAFEALGGEAAGWRNELAPRFIFALPKYAPGTAEQLTMPLLMCLADHDLQASSRFAAGIAARAPYADIRHYPLGHFDVYLGTAFERISDAQVAFLRTHLLPTRRATAETAGDHGPALAGPQWSHAHDGGVPVDKRPTGRVRSLDSGPHREPHRAGLASRLNWLRAGVLGANDGIVSTAGLVVGVAGATTDREAILVAGLAGLVAGALSMAGGEYVSVSSQSDTEKAALALEQWELENLPAAELEELTTLYETKGLTRHLAYAVAQRLTENDALAAHAEVELGLNASTRTSPWHAAFSSMVAFAIGAVLPLAAISTPPLAWRLPVTMVAVTLSLLATGAVSARLGRAPMKPAILRVVGVGLLVMVITFSVGSAVGSVS